MIRIRAQIDCNVAAMLCGIALTYCYVIPFCFGSTAPPPEELSFKVSPKESASARTIAERAITEKRLTPGYFVQAEVSRDKMAEIHVRSVMVCQGKSFLPVLRAGAGMPMITHHELVLVRKGADALQVCFCG